MKKLFEYGADAGTCVINGIGFSNGVGDGGYNVYYCETMPKGVKLFEDIWVDLRNGYGLTIHGHDCNKKGEEYEPNKSFTKEDLNAKGLQIGKDNSGNIYLIKYF